MIQETLMLCNDILHAHLRPWVFGMETEANFEKLQEALQPIPLNFTNTFEVNFEPVETPKQAFYKMLIENESTTFLNEVTTEIKKATSQIERSFLVNKMLSNEMHKKLEDTFQVLSMRKKKEVQSIDEMYVLQLLKHHVLWMYLEIQENFKEYLENPYVRSDEAYLLFFNEEEPQPEIIVGAIRAYTLNFTEYEAEIEPTADFQPIESDVNSANTTTFSYDQLIKKPEFFSKTEEQLYQEGIIDHEYHFQNKYGQKQYLAAIYHQWINKGYFQSRIFPENTEVKPADIISFLNDRYHTDVNKQFRIWSNKPQNLQEFISRKYWLENMISS